MTSQQYADNLVARSCKVVIVYEEENENKVSIEMGDASKGHGLRLKWAQNPLVNLTYIAFEEESLLSIMKGATSTPKNHQNSLTLG